LFALPRPPGISTRADTDVLRRQDVFTCYRQVLTGTPDSVPAVKASCVSRNLERAFALATQRRIRGTGGLLEGAIRRTISHGTCPNDTNIIVDRS